MGTEGKYVLATSGTCDSHACYPLSRPQARPPPVAFGVNLSWRAVLSCGHTVTGC